MTTLAVDTRLWFGCYRCPGYTTRRFDEIGAHAAAHAAGDRYRDEARAAEYPAVLRRTHTEPLKVVVRGRRE